MEITEAIQNIYSLIEQANANGMFKKLSDLDIVRASYNSILEHLKQVKEPYKDDSVTG